MNYRKYRLFWLQERRRGTVLYVNLRSPGECEQYLKSLGYFREDEPAVILGYSEFGEWEHMNGCPWTEMQQYIQRYGIRQEPNPWNTKEVI